MGEAVRSAASRPGAQRFSRTSLGPYGISVLAVRRRLGHFRPGSARLSQVSSPSRPHRRSARWRRGCRDILCRIRHDSSRRCFAFAVTLALMLPGFTAFAWPLLTANTAGD